MDLQEIIRWLAQARNACSTAAAALTLLAGVSVQAADAPARLSLQIDNTRPIVLDLALLQAHAGESIDVQWTRGTAAERSTFSGARVRSLLSLLNVPSGSELRGRWLRYIVTAVGADGYTVSFGLAELEPTLSGRRAIVAWHRDGAAMPAGESPLRLVIEGDTRPSRSVRELIALRVFDPSAVDQQSADQMPATGRPPPSPKTP